MRTTNQVLLVGHLGADPEGFTTSSGAPGARLRLATESAYKDEHGELKTVTDWHRVLVFGLC
jgi:single-strand DNA-binding protein